jgi:hypothetical protein
MSGATRAAVCLGAMLATTAGLVFAQETQYEGGRGLLTLEGPTGMFINPTSATLPQDYGTLQYCIIFPNNENDVIGHGLLGSYGVTDDLELGAHGNYIDLRDASDEFVSGGPFARYRITRDEPGGIPQIGVGAYSRIIGDDELEKVGVFAAAYKRFPIREDGFLRSVGIHLGAKNLWVDDEFNPDDTTASGYGGIEFQFPLRLYAIGEVQTRDDDFQEDTPYAFGLQWRAAGIAMSAAGIQDGTFDEPSFFYGIGWAGDI